MYWWYCSNLRWLLWRCSKVREKMVLCGASYRKDLPSQLIRWKHTWAAASGRKWKPQLGMRNMPKHTPKRETRQPKIRLGGLERGLATPRHDLTLCLATLCTYSRFSRKWYPWPGERSEYLMLSHPGHLGQGVQESVIVLTWRKKLYMWLQIFQPNQSFSESLRVFHSRHGKIATGLANIIKSILSQSDSQWDVSLLLHCIADKSSLNVQRLLGSSKNPRNRLRIPRILF